ncbi:hypothetical protein SNEBB_001204 [Seison nebaliae]|nr:hypothetical protein SNEBB_001204 [Seison nebaliae]
MKPMKSKPDASLLLEWVYGYRGHHCRNNLAYTIDNNIVYFVAGVAIVYNPIENTQKFFMGHNDDIISLSIHPNKIYIATGQVGAEAIIYVWNSQTQKTISILQGGHTDGISSLAFDNDGTKLASVGKDEKNSVSIWDWSKGKIIARTQTFNDHIFDIQFNPYDSNSLVSCGVKHVKFWTICGNALLEKKGIFGKIGGIQSLMCLAFRIPDENNIGSSESELASDRTDIESLHRFPKFKKKTMRSTIDEFCYTGTFSGDIYVWNMKDAKLCRVIEDAHNGTVYTIKNAQNGFVTGGKDSCCKLWDKNFKVLICIDLSETSNGYSGLCIRSLCWVRKGILIGTNDGEIFEIIAGEEDKPKCLLQAHAEGQLWALGIHPKLPIFVTGSDDRTLRIWNSEERRLLKFIRMEHGIRSCAFSNDHNGSRLAVGLMNGECVILDHESGDYRELFLLKNHKEVCHELKYSPNNHYLAVGSNDNSIDIYETKTFKLLGRCSNHKSYITHLDWSKDSQYIQSNSGDGEHLYFEVPSCQSLTFDELSNNNEWHTWTTILGSECLGIWNRYKDITHINAADGSYEQHFIATGDDNGYVKLFRFPTTVKGSKYKRYLGHSAHVTNIRFMMDCTHLISVGGADHAIFQWKVQKKSALSRLRMSTPGGDGQSDIESDEDDVLNQSTMSNVQQSFTDDDDDSGSEMTDYDLDSEIENEKQKSYERSVYKEDLKLLRKKIRDDMKPGEKRAPPPNEGIEIEYVHGYRGYDCHNNIIYIANKNEFIYNVAALGVIYNINNGTQRFYNQHNDDVLSIALHPDQKTAATGQVGRDPSIHVWNSVNLKTLAILKGQHDRGVCSINFSSDGKKLASVGLGDYHMVVIWNWSKGEKLASARGHQDKIFEICWQSNNSASLVTVGVKHIKFWEQTGGGLLSKRGLFGRTAKIDSILCVAFGNDNENCYTGGSNGSIYVWQKKKLQKTIKAHKGPCFAIGSLGDKFVSGGKDGKVIVWSNGFGTKLNEFEINKDNFPKTDLLLKQLPPIKSVCLSPNETMLVGTKGGEIIEIDIGKVSMRIITQGHGEGEVWGLATHPRKDECVTVSDDRTVRIWQLSHMDDQIESDSISDFSDSPMLFSASQNQHRMIKGKRIEYAGRCCAYSYDGRHIGIGMKNGKFTVINSDNLEEVISFQHRKEELSDIKFSPDGKYMVVASHDNFIDIYNLLTRKRVGVGRGASSYVTHIDWDKQSKLIMLNSGAKELLFFEAPRGKRQYVNTNDVKNVNWHTWSGVLGENIEGIWPPCADITDINSTSLSHDGKILATADDFGFVKLFNYPIYGKHSKFKKYIGHSSHVTKVEWTHNDNFLTSVGGNDTTVIIWRHAYNRITERGQSDASDTDSEEEGYDSDVRNELLIDYMKKAYTHPIKRTKVADQTPEVRSRRITDQKHKKIKKARSHEFKERMTRQVKDIPIVKKKVPSTNSNSEITDLKLAYIHGYRGFDCRDNLSYVKDGSACVYHAGAAGIVLDLKTDAQEFYLEHTDDIICLAVNYRSKYENIVATGQIGVDAQIHVWNTATMKQLSILQGFHKKGVCSVDFSSSGKYLLSVGLEDKHCIAVWRWQDGSRIATYSGIEERIFKARFRVDSDSIFVTVGFKHVRFWTAVGGDLLYKRGIISKIKNQTHDHISSNGSRRSSVDRRKLSGSMSKRMDLKITSYDDTHESTYVTMHTMLCVAFATDNITCTGSIIGDVYVWKDTVLNRVVFNAHNGPIFSMYTSISDGYIITSGKEKSNFKKNNDNALSSMPYRSATIKIWDHQMKLGKTFPLNVNQQNLFDDARTGSNNGRSISRYKNKILIGTKNSEIIEIDKNTGVTKHIMHGHGEGSLWGLACHPTNNLFATASYDGTLRLWICKDDVQKMRNCIQLGNPLHCVDFSNDGKYIAVGGKNGEVILLNHELNILQRKRERGACINCVKFSPCSKLIAVGGHDATLDYFTIPQMAKAGYCYEIPNFITQIDWTTDSQYIKMDIGNSYEPIFSSAPDGEIIPVLKDVTWFSWNSCFGPPVEGIWNKGSDVSDINSLCVSHSTKELITGDDFGVVKLFPFPYEKADKIFPQEEKTFYGHSDCVTKVRFLHNDTFAISTGGEDCCVFVWKCIRETASNTASSLLSSYDISD